MEKLPSIVTTYKRSFALYFKSFLVVLPFLLLGAICEYALTRVYPVNPEHTFSLAPLLQSLVGLILFMFVVYGVYVVHQGGPANPIDIAGKAIKRFVPYLAASIIMLLPAIIIGGLLVGILSMDTNAAGPGTNTLGDVAAGLGGTATDVKNRMLLVSAGYITFLILSIIYLVVVIYFWPSMVLIIAKGMGPISGLKTSWNLVKGYWWKTFAILLVYTIIWVVVHVVLQLFLPELYEDILMNILFSPLAVALVVIHTEHLERAKNPN